MTRYLPILKAKPGELEAYGRLTAATRNAMLPIFEWCPADEPIKALEKPTQNAQKFLTPGSRVVADLGALSPAGPHGGSGLPAALWVARELAASGIESVPVVRLDDSPAVLTTLAAVVKQMANPAALLRLPTGAAVAATAPEINAVSQALGVPLGQIHLVLDSRDVDAKSLGAATGTAIAAVQQVRSIGPWASITLASGAFPASISDLAVGSAQPLARADAQLWRDVTGQGHIVDFGDYAVGHPAMPGAGWRPLPSLRYTDERRWLVWRERTSRPGNESFYDLCKKVVADPAYAGAAYSWGDDQIDRCAREVRGPGGGTQWRAFGTSHHLTTVVDRLATLGEP